MSDIPPISVTSVIWPSLETAEELCIELRNESVWVNILDSWWLDISGELGALSESESESLYRWLDILRTWTTFSSERVFFGLISSMRSCLSSSCGKAGSRGLSSHWWDFVGDTPGDTCLSFRLICREACADCGDRCGGEALLFDRARFTSSVKLLLVTPASRMGVIALNHFDQNKANNNSTWNMQDTYNGTKN